MSNRRKGRKPSKPDPIADWLRQDVDIEKMMWPYIQMGRAMERTDAADMMSAPATYAHRVETGVTSALIGFNDGHAAALVDGIGSLHARLGDDFVAYIERAIVDVGRNAKANMVEADRRYSLLVRLLKLAETRVPMGGLLALPMSLDEINRRLRQPLPDFFSMETAKAGEVLSHAAKKATLETLESTYPLYLGVIVRLEGLVRGVKETPAPELGNLVAQAAAAIRRLGPAYAALVDDDAAHFRNASAHKGHDHWTFNPGTGMVAVRDINKPLGEHTPEALQARVLGWYTISGPCLYWLVNWYLVERFWRDTGILKLHLEVLAAAMSHDGDLVRRKEAERIELETLLREETKKAIK